MFHVTLFGSTQGEMAPSGFSALTFFGGTELRRPTLAAEVQQLRNRQQQRPGLVARLLGTHENLVLTFFGGTMITAPTLVEELQALQGLVRSGVVSAAECAELVEKVGAQRRAALRTVTLFGTCLNRLPSASRERKAVQAATADGTVEATLGRALEKIIGAPPLARAKSLAALLPAT